MPPFGSCSQIDVVEPDHSLRYTIPHQHVESRPSLEVRKPLSLRLLELLLKISFT